MGWIALIALFSGQDVAARNVNPPVVGRPANFSGAVGGPFAAQWIVAPAEVTTEEPLALILRITGPGNLAELRRPALGKLESFRPFAVENLDDRFLPGDPPRREFRYRVRPRSATVTEIPPFKFVYFNPRISPPSRGYQTTYADAVPVTVKPRPVAPAEVPAWMLEPPATDELLSPPPRPWQDWVDWGLSRLGVSAEEQSGNLTWPFVAMALLLPPSLCGLWFVGWSRLRPNAARRAAGRRSRAATVALRGLDRAGGRADLVAASLLGYVRDRHGLSATTTTPGEVATALSAADCSGEVVTAVATILKRCDAARFGPDGIADPGLAADAANVILDWEAAA